MTSRANDVLRVAQWTTGNVAAETVKALLTRPDLALVGAYAYSPQKVGVDVGKLCNLGRDLGIYATNDVDALLEPQPDCIIYTPLHFDVVEVQRICGRRQHRYQRGVPNGHKPVRQRSRRYRNRGPRRRCHDIRQRHEPRVCPEIAAISSGISTNVRKASMTESVDMSQFIGDANFQSVVGPATGDPGHADDVRRGTVVFAEAVDVFARRCGLTSMRSCATSNSPTPPTTSWPTGYRYRSDTSAA